MDRKITVVFTGDSITDAGRDYNNICDLGKGYPKLAMSSLLLDYPNMITAYNFAVSGYRSSQILCRWECECLDYKPDLIVLLMGANDAMYELHSSNKNGDKKFEAVTRLMFEDIKSDLSENAKVLTLAPYVFDGAWTENRYDEVKVIIKSKRDILKKLCNEFGFDCVDLQETFDNYSKEHSLDDSFWTVDGVHPTFAGHELISRIVVDYFKKHFA